MRYTAEQVQWLKDNAGSKVWKGQREFTDSFNLTFNENKTVGALFTYMYKNNIKFLSEGRLTAEQIKWIKENVRAIEWRNTKHFTDTFNAIFGTNKNKLAMNDYICRNGLQLLCPKTMDHYTDEMRQWLIKNYKKYECDFVRMAEDFNKIYGTNYSASRITKYCERNLKIHTPKKKKGNLNKGTFQTGNTLQVHNALPVGTIRYNNDGRPYIKVLESDGKSGKLSKQKGHSFKEPWWKPLQKKIWEDHYGEVPEGYVVISLNGNPNDTDIKNIGIIDKRGTARMAKNGWWTDNSVITGDGAQWCNLYYTAKDNRIAVRGL